MVTDSDRLGYYGKRFGVAGLLPRMCQAGGQGTDRTRGRPWLASTSLAAPTVGVKEFSPASTCPNHVLDRQNLRPAIGGPVHSLSTRRHLLPAPPAVEVIEVNFPTRRLTEALSRSCPPAPPSPAVVAGRRWRTGQVPTVQEFYFWRVRLSPPGGAWCVAHPDEARRRRLTAFAKQPIIFYT